MTDELLRELVAVERERLAEERKQTELLERLARVRGGGRVKAAVRRLIPKREAARWPGMNADDFYAKGASRGRSRHCEMRRCREGARKQRRAGGG